VLFSLEWYVSQLSVTLRKIRDNQFMNRKGFIFADSIGGGPGTLPCLLSLPGHKVGGFAGHALLP
jgi:hypothetical protein